MNALEASTFRPPVGRPLIISGDPLASLRGRGASVSSNTALGRLLRESPRMIAELHEQEIAHGTLGDPAGLLMALDRGTAER